MKAIAIKTVVLATAICALSVPALADDTDASTSAITPADFAWDAALINLEEIRLGEAAQTNSQTKAVQQFGKHMVRDHSRMENQLAKIAAAEGLQLPDTNIFDVRVTPSEEKPATELMTGSPQDRLLGTQLDVEHLGSLNGPDFDREYADAMVNGHQKAIDKYQNAASSLDDPALKKYAGKNLKGLNHHLEMAQKLQGQVSGSNPPPNNPPM